MTVFDPTQVEEAVEVNVNTRVDATLYSDKAQTTVLDVTSKTVTAKVKTVAGTWITDETITVVSASAGTVYVTLTGSNYVTAGDGEIRWYVDDALCFPRFTLTWIEEPV